MSTSSSKTATKKTAAAPAKKTAAKKVAEPVPEEVPEVKKERVRREVTKESVDVSFTELVERVHSEIERIRSVDDKKVKGVKFLRSINKALKCLHADTKRVTKLKKNKNKEDGTKKTNVSGFLKPVRISPELASFTGWDVNGTFSRVDVTKFICGYVKTKELNKPSDKRVIQCDDALAKLLNYDAATAPIDPKTELPQEMNYYRLQQYLKGHFIKIETPKDATDAATPAKAKKAKAAEKVEKTATTAVEKVKATPAPKAAATPAPKAKAVAKKSKPEPTPAPTPAPVDDEDEEDEEDVEDEEDAE
jgi:chromatin remodeling complex protein RSC6